MIEKPFELSAERLAEIEADLDDDSGYLIKLSTLKHIIEQEVRRALGQINHPHRPATG